MEEKVYPSMDAFLAENKEYRKPEPPQEPLMNNREVQEFMELMKRHGLLDDVKTLDHFLTSFDAMKDNMGTMRQEIKTLQNEVESLSSDTPLTDQFKQEVTTRSINIWKHLDDFAHRLLDAKDSILEAIREGIRHFKDKGKAALHGACAKIYGVGIDLYQHNLMSDRAYRASTLDIIDRVDNLNDATQSVRHQRRNLLRSMVGKEPKAGLNPKDSTILSAVRKLAEADLEKAEYRIEKGEEMLEKLSSKRRHHLEAAQRKPSIDDRLSSAQKRADQQKSSDKAKYRSNTDRSLT